MSQEVIPELRVTPENIWKWAEEFAAKGDYESPKAVLVSVLGEWCYITNRQQKTSDLTEKIWDQYINGPPMKPVSSMEKDELLKEVMENIGENAEDMNDLLSDPWFLGVINSD
jgi:hypothetical protein